MEKFEKTIFYTELFNLYGPLLSKAQQEILSDYFFLDLSISEISENRKVSRAAIEDALSKGTKKLEQYEKELKLREKRVKVRAKADELRKLIKDEEALKVLDDMIEEF